MRYLDDRDVPRPRYFRTRSREEEDVRDTQYALNEKENPEMRDERERERGWARVFKVRRKCRRRRQALPLGETMHVARLPFEIRFERVVLDVFRAACARPRASERERARTLAVHLCRQAIGRIVYAGYIVRQRDDIEGTGSASRPGYRGFTI